MYSTCIYQCSQFYHSFCLQHCIHDELLLINTYIYVPKTKSVCTIIETHEDYHIPLLQDFVSNSVQCLLLKEASEFPRLLTLPPSHLLPLITHRGNPLLLLPSLKHIFPSLSNLTVIDLKTSPDSTQVLRESGHQIVSVLDSNSSPLTLCVPLPVGRRRTVKWLSAFERALRYSLSCHVTGCCLSFPKQLMGLHGATGDEDQCKLSL